VLFRSLGVETAADLTMCRDLGVDAVQGYWFVRPLASAECGDWLARRGLACVASA
jgi:EAL domain-containing protein (putative c-di-GMP-specific phosphodiesterase class I)